MCVKSGHFVTSGLLHILDPHRFPWIAEDRAPAGHELEQAVVASAALVAARKVETSRRNDAKDVQEARVKDLLREIGFREVPPRDIPLLDAAPAPGEFCGESKLGDTRADKQQEINNLTRFFPTVAKL